jgi:hypothetical protein
MTKQELRAPGFYWARTPLGPWFPVLVVDLGHGLLRPVACLGEQVMTKATEFVKAMNPDEVETVIEENHR